VNTPYTDPGMAAILVIMLSRESGKSEDAANGTCRNQIYPPARILIVDADPGLCRSSADMLERHGYATNTQEDAETAWAQLQTRHYHLLITANDLPGLTGVGLIRRIRSACMSLPVIIAIRDLPAWQSPEYPWLLKATRLFKPYTFEYLLNLVKNIFPAPDRFREVMALPASRQNQSASDGLVGRQEPGPHPVNTPW
jgi:DNA-binding NtrC family response regulator